jgi:hypothetical protein
VGGTCYAFGAHLSLAALLIAVTTAGVLASASPAGGGMGVAEAGLILALTASGITKGDATAAVFVQRLFPPISHPLPAGSPSCGCAKGNTYDLRQSASRRAMPYATVLGICARSCPSTAPSLVAIAIGAGRVPVLTRRRGPRERFRARALTLALPLAWRSLVNSP